MDRLKFLNPFITPLVLALVLFEASPVAAGTVLMEAAPPRDPNFRSADDEFAESRFGIQPNLAARETREMERESRDEFAAAEGKISQFGPSSERMSAQRAPASESPQAAPQARSSVTVDADVLNAARRKGVQEVALIAGDLGFFPKTVFVTRDIPVRMFVTGASKNSLCIMMDSFQVRKQIRSQRIEEITFTPTVPGKYRFYCPVNGMEGSMIVRELVSS